MTQLIPLEPDHIVGFRIEGNVKAEDLDEIADVVERKLENYSKIGMYLEIADLKGMSLKALLKDAVFGIKHLKHFERIVVVTNKDWIEKVVALENAIIPKLETKVFPFDEKERAMAWLLAPIVS